MSGHDNDMIPPRLLDAASAGCEESRLLVNRRALMGMSAGLFAWANLPKQAAAATPAQRRLLVVVLRGGLDGLHVAYRAEDMSLLHAYRSEMFRTHGDYLATNYGLLTSTSNHAVATTFMLHNVMPNFRKMYQDGEAALVHAIAPPLQTRSHFDCQANVESGQPGIRNINNEGWLNRFLQGLEGQRANQPLKRALALNNVPLIIKGAADVQSWTSAGMQDYGDDFLTNFVEDYATKESWKRNLELGLALNKEIKTKKLDVSRGAMPFSVAGALMADPLGPRIAAISVDGLDSHASQLGVLDSKLAEIDRGLGAFKDAMVAEPDGSDVWKETVVVCVTEFGRTVRDNSSGTDHGVGTVAFLAGGNVKGGRVLTNWPGIRYDDLLNRGSDLRPTLDVRSLFRGLLKDHLGCDNDTFLNSTVFPGTTRDHVMRDLVLTGAEGLRILPQSAWARA